MSTKKEPIDLSQFGKTTKKRSEAEKKELSFSRSLKDSKAIQYVIQNTGKTVDTPKKALFIIIGVSFLLIALSLFFIITRPILTTPGKREDASSRPGTELEYGR